MFIQKNRPRTTVAEPIGETLAELPFTGDQAVCLGHEQAAWSGPASTREASDTPLASDAVSVTMPVRCRVKFKQPQASTLLKAGWGGALLWPMMADDVNKLRQLAAWYREFDERAGSPWVWEARLRTAQELEAEADQRGRRAMKSAEELRAEARRLRDAVKTLSDPRLKKELAARALDLAHKLRQSQTLRKIPRLL
jgi:hypothetical protein